MLIVSDMTEQKQQKQESRNKLTTELTDEIKTILKDQDIEMLEPIDNGSTSIVFKGLLTIDGGQVVDVAIKFVNLDKQSDKVRNKYIPQEISLVERLKHKHIIRTYKVVKHKNKYVFIVSELADGDLIKVLEKGELLDEKLVREWFRQIVKAVEYIHRKGVAHRDLKADNILIVKNTMKLCDFGYARQSRNDDGSVKMVRTLCGTIEYASPESLSRLQPFDPMVSDCFSLGVVLYTMLTLNFPFGSGDCVRSKEGRSELLANIKAQQWSLPDNYKDNNNICSLLKQLLNPDPSGRIRSCQILSHPWFSTIPSTNHLQQTNGSQ
ncbi:testis-specific serine/threonine-protein kinase 3-like [Oppia nitens]|uniref:testis-specific serine/threonine-protein kinase 3-like n=1 Tax=Oppia nitens TaxID=1686743 RepID=UPI0023DA1AE5|nr:testis-specific serine/threonine-protein kinase 3-like [Oppia nitens]